MHNPMRTLKYLAFDTITLRPARRTAALLCAALLCLGLAATTRTSAQVTGPLAAPYASPKTPTPFQWQNYHSGGAPIPATQFPVAPDPNAAVGLTPLIDPLQSQLQGTPTELYQATPGGPSVLTEIPSFLLGNYDPTRPPAGLDPVTGNLPFYPNHFQDGSIFSWAAPFSYVAQGIGTVTVDDSPIQAPTATASGFTINPANGAWVSVTDPNSATPGPTTSPAAATATGDEYLRLPSGVAGTAIWTLYEPSAGVYSVYFHIPNDLPDSNGVAEVRDTQVLYFIRVLDANGNVTANTTATVSQTEANDSQLLAGPFQVAAGGSVVVTLTRSLSNPVINNNLTHPDYLVADSMTLQQTVGDVQSAPTVVTRTSYPTDFNNAQYWGVFITPSVLSTSPNPATAAAANANPDTTTGDATGNILLKTGNPATALGTTGIADPTRIIRQLVYFGRSDPSASVTNTVDDSNQARFSGSGTTANNAPTASNNEYRISATAPGTTPTNIAATWTVPVPAAGAGSNFFVYAHIPATATGELRLPHVFYTVTVTTGVTAGGLPVQTTYNAAISQQTQGADALVVLPTGTLTPAAGTNIVVTMYSQNNSNAPSPTGTVVVADSVNVSTGTGQGAIYCVDGFTGGVVWRFPTPGSANGASAPVFASPAIAKINVVVTPATAATPAVYANKLVVIVGDNNGLVYCLDAMGNGDGTSNFDVLNPATLQPVTTPQPAYGAVVPRLAAGTPAATAALTGHVGTTGVYWIYRPDATQPKYVTGTAIGAVKPVVDPTTDLPVPAAFGTASPTISVDPTVPTATPTLSNSTVYIGNSNGVLYALDGGGVSINGSGVPTNGIGTPASFKASGDTFNVSQDVQQSQPFPKLVIPTAQPRWWFSLRGVDPNGAENTSSADIESAPALYIKRTPNALAGTTTYVPTVYIGSAHEQEVTSNVGRLYALNGVYGPSGNNGRSSPIKQPNPASANYTGPGSYNYNVGQIPQISKTDTADWSYPDGVGTTAYATGKSSDGNPRPALGNITGSPVVFTNIDETVGNPTRIYIAANSGLEPTTATLVPVARPDDTQTGRLWAVNLDGSVGTTTNSGLGGHVWSYPVANNPNDKTKDNVAEPYPPIGAFLRGTPAIGFVQFPLTIQFTPTAGGAVSTYSPADAVHTGGIAGQSVPMLYVGTRGVNDTSLYAVDIDGDMTALPQTVVTTASGTAQNDQRTIYRLVTPDGSIYQSSPALVTNATINTTGTGGTNNGNGGSVYAVAGNSLYDYGATPISNPFAGNDFPLIPENKVFVGFGPISSPALAGADTTDLSQAFLGTPAGTPGLSNTSAFTTNTTDWVIVGDSTSGLCRGITPNDLTYGGIPPSLGSIIPPDPNAPLTQLLTAEIQTFLVPDLTTQNLTSSKADGVGPTAALPVYDWGESAYVAFTNVAPPNPTNKTALYVYDHNLYPDLTAANANNKIPFYTSDGTTAQTVTFGLSDVDATTGTSILQTDNGSVLPANYFVDPGSLTADTTATPAYTQAVANVVQNLQTTANTKYIGTYTYTIGDGSARNNTPGARRRFQNVRQVVTEYDYDGTSYTRIGNVVIGGDATANNIVPAPDGKSFLKIASVDQPTFGILNPLAVRGGGVNLLPISGVTSVNAVQVGDEEGPFRSVEIQASPLPTFSTQGTGDVIGLQALTNGNDVLAYAPPSSSGVGASPIALPNPATDPTAPAPFTTKVVVTATGLISHNSVGDNSEPRPTLAPQGTYRNGGNDGLPTAAPFGGYGLDAADRSALFNLGQTLRLKSTVPTTGLGVPSTGRDGLYWNSNVPTNTGFGTSGHESVVNFLPWETPPTPYSVGINSSQDYPDIAPGNVVQNAASVANSANPPVTNSGGDLTSNSVTLTPGVIGTARGSGTAVQNRIVYGDPVQIKITVPNHQPANQQLYQQAGGSSAYDPNGQIAPVTSTGTNNITQPQAFPMGYIANKRLFVPSASGIYSVQRPYRDVHIYTGVPVDIRTSIATPTTDIGQVPAAFGVQTEKYTPLGFFTPYSQGTAAPNLNPFLPYFKPLEVHNDGNVNLLNAHFDQRYANFNNGGSSTLLLNSDAVDPLSALLGYDIPPANSTYGTTGPRPTGEEPFLIRSSLDTDIFNAYGRNPLIASNYSAFYPGATFHKPLVGSDQPSTLTVPDAPENYVAGASLDSYPTPLVPNNTNGVYKSAPFVSVAIPFGTPVGTYSTPAPQSPLSLRLFEGLDAGSTAAATAYSTTSATGFLYPPQYNGAIGGIGKPNVSTNGLPEVYTAGQPLSTTGTQLSATVTEQRLTDGFTYGAVPMIDAGPAGSTTPRGGGTAVPASTPDFAPAAFRDFGTGNLSVYWTTGRFGGFGIYGANLPFAKDPANNDQNFGHFMPTNPTGQWWHPFTPGLSTTGINSGLSIAQDYTVSGSVYAFAVNVAAGTPYANTLYCYPVTTATYSGGAVTPDAVGTAQKVSSDPSQVKYGIKALYVNKVPTGFTNNLYAFWTANTRGRTALYYNSRVAGTGDWPLTSGLLPVPAGLTAVSDASPLLMPVPPFVYNSVTYTSVIEVTYSGTGPDGNADIYVSRYLPDAKTPAQLDLVPFPAVTENLRAQGNTGWYQGRDTAWSRSGALNISLVYKDANGPKNPSLLYGATTPFAPQFTKAIYDKASGYLVLTGVQVPIILTTINGTQAYTTNTVYVDAATGRIRFSPALLPTQNFGTIRATFSPLARRLTTDSRADVGPVTFLDDTPKPNDVPIFANVNASRRWTIWRKSGVAGVGSTATLYYKTQRLTLFLPSAVGATVTTGANNAPVVTPLLSSVRLNGTDVTKQVDVDYLRGRIYFPIALNAEGQTATVTYTDTSGTVHTGTTAVTDTVQWQDEAPANYLPTANDPPPVDSVSGLDTVIDTPVPISPATNENNLAAFLDPYAGTNAAYGGLNSHKVWLFWNSTRNGTADIYSETIDPRFAPGPTIP